MFQELCLLLERENLGKCYDDRRSLSYCLIDEENGKGKIILSHLFLDDDVYEWSGGYWRYID